jgi:putative ABC transport system permease protein
LRFATLSARNITRNKTRVILTVIGVAIAVMAFLIFRTVLWAFSIGAESAAKDRIATRDSVSFIMRLPKTYADKIREVPGVKAATWADWWGGQDPRDKHNFFGTFAVDQNTYLDVYPEIVVSPEAKAKFQSDRQACIIGDVLAKKLKVKEGENVTLTSQIYPGEYQFHVAGVYTVTSKAVDRSTFLFRWDYFNDRLPEKSPAKDHIGWIISRIDDAGKSGEISKRVDDMFSVYDQSTLTMSERALQQQFLGTLSAILKVIDIVSILILLIMMLILGNTIAMGVRERTHEYGTLRAIGFEPRHVGTLIVLESAFVGLVGGLLGLALGSMLINGIRPTLEEGGLAVYFPFFQLSPLNAAVGLGLAVLLGALAAAIPAYRASRLSVTDALRRVG